MNKTANGGSDKLVLDLYPTGCVYIDKNTKAFELFNIFVSNFSNMFPGIISRDELYKRLFNNVKNVGIANYVSNNDTFLCGYYDENKKEIFINSILEHKDFNLTFFHEFVHAITSDKNNTFEEDEFITESITTFLEKIYSKKMYSDFDFKNSYITKYVEELYEIFGNQLISLYINDKKKIDKLFDSFPSSSSSKEVAYDFSRLASNISKLTRTSLDYNCIDYLNFNMELNIALLLDGYLKDSNLTDSVKIEKINRLFNMQINPNIDIYMNIIDKRIKSKDVLNKYNDLKCLYYQNYNGIKESTINKYNKYIVAKKFSFTNIYARCNDVVGCNLYSYNSRYYSDFLKYKNEYYVLGMLFDKGICNPLSNVNVKSIKTDDTSTSYVYDKLRYNSDDNRSEFSNILSRVSDNDKTFYVYKGSIYYKCSINTCVTYLKSRNVNLDNLNIKNAFSKCEGLYICEGKNNIIFDIDGITYLLEYENDKYVFRNYLLSSSLVYNNNEVKKR